MNRPYTILPDRSRKDLHLPASWIKLKDRASIRRWERKGHNLSVKKDRVLVERKIEVVNKLGLHARPAAMLVSTAGKYKSQISLKKGDVEANAKSILSVMMLAAEVGSFVTIKAQGEDEQQAAQAIAQLFEQKFGEE
jgi:phosphocarrier protein HPr